MQFKSSSRQPEDYGNVSREKINMKNVEFNIHWRDIERWAWEKIIQSGRVYSKLISKKYLPGAVERLVNFFVAHY